MLLRRLLVTILVCCCSFVVLPLAHDTPDSEEWVLFDDFMTHYNKSYKNNSTAVLQRFRVFQVGIWSSRRPNGDIDIHLYSSLAAIVLSLLVHRVSAEWNGARSHVPRPLLESNLCCESTYPIALQVQLTFLSLMYVQTVPTNMHASNPAQQR